MSEAEICGIWCGGPESDGQGGEWRCGRPKGHPHDGTRPTRGNHTRQPLPQDEARNGETGVDRPHCLDCLQPRNPQADRHCRATSTRMDRTYHRWSNEAGR